MSTSADRQPDRDADQDGHAVRYRQSRRRYTAAWAVLLVLLMTTAGLARLHLGVGNLVVSLSIAVLKAGIVAWVFMALREAQALIRFAACAGLVGLLLLGGLSGADFGPRHDEPASWQAPQTIEPQLTQQHVPRR